MRRLLQFLFKKPLTWLANHFSAKPDKEAVFKSLSRLYLLSHQKKQKKIAVLDADAAKDKFIIFSDQHKGNGDKADDFAQNEQNYIAALNYYRKEGYSFINLGDCEELWKYKASAVLPAYQNALMAESAFHPKKYYRVFGNHDLLWKNSMDVKSLLKDFFKMPLHVYEGILLKLPVDGHLLHIFLTHGHQGDKMSDNNAFSTWLVAHIWAPVQRYLQVNVNSPSKDDLLRHKHNHIMYEWSLSKRNTLLVTGHTHKPVFGSGRYSTHPSNYIYDGNNENLKPSYFNTGCCCFSDGDITGIEICSGSISLIKWHRENGISKRKTLEEKTLSELCSDLGKF